MRHLVYVTIPILLMGLISGQALARFKDITPAADTNVSESAGDSAFGTSSSMWIQSGSGTTPGDKRLWLRFALTDQLPPGAAIQSAKLRMYAFEADPANDLTVDVVGCADDTWEEDGITWNSQPALGSVLASATLHTPYEYLWYEFDVTGFVLTEFAADGTVSLVVKPQSEGDSPSKTYKFDSREYLKDGYSLVPRLRVEFTGAWPSANSINVIHTNDIHSRLTSHDLDFPDVAGQNPGLEEAGGAAYMAAKVVELKKAKIDSLVLDAGDVSEGNPLGDLRGNGGIVDYFQTLNAQLKAMPSNTSGRGVDAVVIGNHDIREKAMMDNAMDPDGDGVMNGWVDTNGDDIVDTYNPPGTDLDDVPYIAVNLVRKGATKPAPAEWPIELPFRPYVMVTIGTTRIAVLGYLTDDSAILTPETEPLVDVLETAWTDKENGVTMTNVVQLEEWVAYLRKPVAQGGEGADVVILLSHIGHRRLSSDGNVGYGDGNDELLGDTGSTAPPDLVVSGHWHTWTGTAWQPCTLNYKTTNVEAASYGQYVGEVTLSAAGRYISAVKHPIRVSDFTFPNPDSDVDNAYNAINALIANLRAEYEALTGPDCVIDAATIQTQVPGYNDGSPCPLDYVVGYSAVALTLDKDKWFTLSEFPWSGDNTAGAWICDAMVDKVRNLDINGDGTGPGNAHLAIQSGGGIRRDIAAGPITYREIFEVYPWDDDAMVRVQMSSQDVWNYIEGHYVGSSLSADWQVSAEDGIITSINYSSNHDGNFDTALSKTDDVTTWNVIISEYMYRHDDWINETGGTDDTFTTIDPTPEYIAADGGTSGLPITGHPAQIRDSVVEYTARFQAGNPLTVAGPRYILNTEMAGEFEAVVTMTADAETQPYFEAVFVRLLKASDETQRRRDLPGDPYGLVGLVEDDGSINPNHEFAETMLYRSHLGFPDGYLQVGDRLNIRGEFGFFAGNAQFVDQEGIVGAEKEFDLLSPDDSFADPIYFASTDEFFVDEKENHLVKFYARRTGKNTVQDSKGVSRTIYREGGFYSSSTHLPGVNGDCLELIGVQTERADGDPDTRRFRLREAYADPFGNGSCFPPSSYAAGISGTLEVGSMLTINATSEDLNGFSSGGGSFFAGMDLDGEGAALPLTMTFSGIDISGETSLQLKLKIAEDDATDGNEDWDAADYVHIDYRIDGAAYQNLLHIENDGSTYNTAPQIDTDFDGIGDGTEITSTFTAFMASIAGTGSSLDLRITFNLDAGDEDIAFDDIEIVNGGSNSLMLEDFEDAMVAYTTSVPEFTDGSGDFFIRTDGSGIGSAVEYSGQSSGGSQLYGTVESVDFYASTDGGETFSLIGTDNTAGDGFSYDYTPTAAGELLFYTVATDDDGLVEASPMYADLTVTISAPTPVPAVPAVSHLGLIALALAVLVMGAVTLGRHDSQA